MGLLRTAFYVVIVGVSISYWLSCRRRSSLPYNFGGFVEPGFEEVEKAFRKNFEDGLEPDGAAYAACYQGKLVVDLWGGYADKMALRRWKQDTMTTAFSTTKGVAALIIAMLVDRGQLDYDALVTKYWPEFGKNGKANVTVKMLVSHEAGLVGLDQAVAVEDVKDWRRMSVLFENQVPNWPPGRHASYHVITFGFLCDQLVRRVDTKKRSLGQFFNEEVAKPFGIDFYIGLPRDQVYRVARISQSTLWDTVIRLGDWEFVKFMACMMMIPNPDYMQKSTPEWLTFQEPFSFNDPDVQELEIAAANGIGTARGLAQLFCLLEGPKLLSDKTLKRIFTPSIPTYEQLTFGGTNLSWAYGFILTENPWGSYQLGHPGFGGQNAKFDAHERLGVAYLRNHMAPDMLNCITSRRLENATYESILRLKSKG